MATRFRGSPPPRPVPNSLSLQIKEQFQQALALHQSGHIGQAQAIYLEILKLQPKHFDSLHLLGVTAFQVGELELSAQLISDAIQLNPNFAPAYDNLGNTLVGLKRAKEALASFDKALALKPDYAEAWNNRGNALKNLGRLDEALASFDKALTFKPDFAEACNNRANILLDLRRFNEALASFDKALTLKPDYAEACNNRGNALLGLGRTEEALASYERAFALKPDYAEACNNRGNALKDLARFEEAVTSYERALALKPDCEFLFGNYLITRMRICNWESLAENLVNYKSAIRERILVTTPFPTLSLFDDPELHLTASQTYSTTQHPGSGALGSFVRQVTGEKIRIGYYSADFHNHATAYLMAELFEEHDADRFELYGFSFGPDEKDDMRKRISGALHEFLDVRAQNDREVARLSRDIGIDIAVDLKGYTQDARTGLFAEGCAPVQVNYLGYPGSMGAEYMDYIIADKTVIPVERQNDFTEKVVYLPYSYQVNDSKRKISDRIFTRPELGLPETGFVFCCFNNNYKILPEVFDCWARILKAVDGSVLWLLEGNPAAARNLCKEAEARGLDADRLVFASRMLLDDHLARHKLADLFLDTLPYNAHTTASDALWAGVPVLTRMGKSFASRVAASLLNAVEMPELITSTMEEYERKAVDLAINMEKLAQLKIKLESNKASTALFNGKLFARHLEYAYETMYARCQAGLAPEMIECPPGI